MNSTSGSYWSPRTRGFFWLGMLLCPVFWVWWTGGRRFSSGQPIGSTLWTALYLTTFLVTLPQMRERYELLIEFHTVVALVMVIGLSLLLLFRCLSVFELLTLLFVIPPHLWLTSVLGIGEPPPMSDTIGALVALIVISLLHLAVDPMRKFYRRVKRVSVCFGCPICKEDAANCTHPFSTWRTFLKYEDP